MQETAPTYVRLCRLEGCKQQDMLKIVYSLDRDDVEKKILECFKALGATVTVGAAPAGRVGGLVPALRRLIGSRLDGPPARREAALQALEAIGGPKAWLDAANWRGNREPITTARHSFRGAYRSAKPRVLAAAASRQVEGTRRARLEARAPTGANDAPTLAGLPQVRRMDG